ncbi:hypothetical protein AMTR_s00224p00009210 [Amborella trichopoda]|uniref:TCP domain-containing protein n=1 Tax=Amborella trichopoda TaxID=13333 RepID=W1P2I2_AMBTC|nr:hypothetical protein AMTR_s00224p00009210 [Amborella trichopoda]
MENIFVHLNLMNNFSVSPELWKMFGGIKLQKSRPESQHCSISSVWFAQRFRLSAHTAIKFYDLQVSLGYNRFSKGVDWLITRAKSAIDELAELPTWQPTTVKPPKPTTGTSLTKTRASLSSSLKPITQNLSHSHSSIAAQSNPPSSFLLPPMETES